VLGAMKEQPKSRQCHRSRRGPRMERYSGENIYLAASDGPEVLLGEFQNSVNCRRLQRMTGTIHERQREASEAVTR
jgi:hypothetical protein